MENTQSAVVPISEAPAQAPQPEAVPLTETQQQRVAAFRAELAQAAKDLDEVRKREAALRMGVESVLATILECNGKSMTQRYLLAEDGKSLVPAKGEGINGLAQ